MQAMTTQGARSVLMLHNGERSMRGTEICVIEAAKGLVEAGFTVVIGRNADVIDKPIREFSDRVTLVDMVFPELMIAGERDRLSPRGLPEGAQATAATGQRR
jgi:hypothetical protein